MRAPASVREALAGLRSAVWPRRLMSIYQQLPQTTCGRRGDCCGLLPPLAPAEALAWLDRVGRATGAQRAAQCCRLVAHFLLNAAQRRDCPWTRPKACAIYENRFFACRAYGLWSPGAYEKRRRAARERQEQVVRAWQGLGVDLPSEVLAAGPAYCDRVRPLGAPLSDAALQDLENRVYALAADHAQRGPLAWFQGDLSFLLAGLALGQDQALSTKLAVTRSLLAGRVQQARELLGRAERQTRHWALRWQP